MTHHDLVLDGLDRTAALRAMVRRTPPPGCGVIEGSTPVLAFGDVEDARVATLGINPSQAEFLKIKKGQAKTLLAGSERRLASLPSLGAASLQALTDEQVDEVIADCRGYFHRKPLTVWFDQLGHALAGLDASYDDGSACHLDISMWATNPKWNHLESPAQKALLRDGESALRWLLTHGGFDTVVVNGAAVWAQLAQMGLATGAEVEKVPFGHGSSTTTVKRATFASTRLVGWTGNLQSTPGFRTVDKVTLGTTVRAVLDAW